MVGPKRMKLQNFRKIINFMELCKVDKSSRNHEIVCNLVDFSCVVDNSKISMKNLNRFIMNVMMNKEHVIM